MGIFLQQTIFAWLCDTPWIMTCACDRGEHGEDGHGIRSRVRSGVIIQFARVQGALTTFLSFLMHMCAILTGVALPRSTARGAETPHTCQPPLGALYHIHVGPKFSSEGWGFRVALVRYYDLPVLAPSLPRLRLHRSPCILLWHSEIMPTPSSSTPCP